MMSVSGEAARRSGSASSPERPGIVMSSNNTSGRSARSCSIASSAPAASAVTTRSGSRSSRRRRAERTCGLSSQIWTRKECAMTPLFPHRAQREPWFPHKPCAAFRQPAWSGRKLDHERGACTWRRFDLEASAQQSDTLTHPDQTKRTLANTAGQESDAVILDYRSHRAFACRRDDDADRGSLRVLDYV